MPSIAATPSKSLPMPEDGGQVSPASSIAPYISAFSIHGKSPASKPASLSSANATLSVSFVALSPPMSGISRMLPRRSKAEQSPVRHSAPHVVPSVP